MSPYSLESQLTLGASSDPLSPCPPPPRTSIRCPSTVLGASLVTAQPLSSEPHFYLQCPGRPCCTPWSVSPAHGEGNLFHCVLQAWGKWVVRSTVQVPLQEGHLAFNSSPVFSVTRVSDFPI